MRYGEMNGAAVKRLTVPRLDGGLNQSGAAHRIADNQLADGVNLWWQEGALRTRPGFQTGPAPWTDPTGRWGSGSPCAGLWSGAGWPAGPPPTS